MGEYRKRAWADTYRSLGGAGLLAPVVLIVPVGFGIHYLIDPGDMMGEVEIWLVYGLAATGLVFSAFFLWNLACAPFRIERDARQQVEVRVAELENLLPKPDSLADDTLVLFAIDHVIPAVQRLQQVLQRMLRENSEAGVVTDLAAQLD